MLNPTFNSNFPLDIFIVLEAKGIVLFLDASQPLSSQLYKDLMADYQPDVLPLYNKSKPVEVDFGYIMILINFSPTWPCNKFKMWYVYIHTHM